ncbi:MAG: riboflavin synthase [Calditrichota bacterium]
MGAEHRQQNLILQIKADVVLNDLKTGDSVAVSGPCLTVIERGRDWFKVEASSLTIQNTTIGTWRSGRRLNLERALRLSDRLGGHLVQGNVDGVGETERIRFASGFTEIQISSPPPIRSLLISKGSIALDGVSLTISEKTTSGFKLMVIPYTLERTTLGGLKPGDRVNLETDLVIRWLAERFPNQSSILPKEWTENLGGFHLED